MSDGKTFVKSHSRAEVEEKVEEADSYKKRLARVYENNKKQIQLTAGMAAETVGGLAGGAIVGAMRAYDVEEFGLIASVATTAIAGMKRLDEPNNPYWHGAFTTGVGMGAALVAGKVEDYLTEHKNGQ